MGREMASTFDPLPPRNALRYSSSKGPGGGRSSRSVRRAPAVESVTRAAILVVPQGREARSFFGLVPCSPWNCSVLFLLQRLWWGLLGVVISLCRHDDLATPAVESVTRDAISISSETL